MIRSNLKYIRKRIGMKQQDMADKMGVTRACWCWWETGRTDLSTSQLVQLRKMLGIDIDTLLMKDIRFASVDFDEVRKRVYLYDTLH